MIGIDKALFPALRERESKALYRRRAVLETAQGTHLTKNGKSLISFCSNDYLGLANHPKVVEAFSRSATEFGVGSGASHLVTGHSVEHQRLEEELAEYTGRDRVLLFSTGYMANLGVVNALSNRDDVILQDKLNHASLLDAGLLSAGRMMRFNHSDVSHLRSRLTKLEARRRLIVVDGVFSMDGDLAPLPDLVKCAHEHDAWLMVDDAHGIGCLGENGRGIVEHFRMSQQEVPILVGTLGKAFGTFGAFVAGSEILIESLIQFARTYIYTTALPPSIAAATRASLALIREEPERREHLEALVERFRQNCKSLGLDIMSSSTAIQPIVVTDADRALRISQQLEQKGFWVTAIRPPTVPAGTSRLRITLSANHSFSEIDSLTSALGESIAKVAALRQ